MSQYLLLKQGTIHNAVDEEAFVADILIEDGKIKKIAPVLEGKVINEAAVIDAMGSMSIPGLWMHTAIWGSTVMRSVLRGRTSMNLAIR